MSTLYRPSIAILGRPNVGKSTLFNVLARPPKDERTNIVRAATMAITHAQAGTTRDVRKTPGNLFGLRFMLLDTAGIEEAGEKRHGPAVKKGSKAALHVADDPALQSALNKLAYGAAEAADIHILMIDGATGVSPADRALAQKLRRMNKPLIIVLNKADLREAESHIADIETLGFGEPVMVSAAHSQGLEDLYHVLKTYVAEEPEEDEEAEDDVADEAEDMPEGDEASDDDEGPETDAEADYSRFPKRPEGAIRLAIMGRPNVGKSTLTNALLGTEAMLTGPTAGLTREAVPHDFEYNGQAFTLIDTPGLRRKNKVDKESLEFLSVGQSLQAVEKADVVILVIDASTHNTDTGNWEIFEQQDAQIAAVAMNQYKPLILALNKWDEVKDKPTCLEDIKIQMHHRMHAMHKPLAIPISALKEKGLDKLMNAVCDVFEQNYATFSTGKLNNLLSRVLAKRSPPLANGKMVSLKFIRQSDTNPPTFTFWGNRISEVRDSYKQFLRNQLSEALGLDHLPVKIFFKANKNPYSGSGKKKSR
ncbi:MAG: ribosome biogenesis GTPase Der [Blastochloris viridis]|uniref:GTPase Der n=1 Tax=Blastochloris viridis TaxID=1079 RepID=A0A6N4QYI2_BLAVI|nr:MAG: ribosome biogenesis GTPase Der [Blastochloris viridis]